MLRKEGSIKRREKLRLTLQFATISLECNNLIKGKSNID
jgi:hypothetical protein